MTKIEGPEGDRVVLSQLAHFEIKDRRTLNIYK